jgi:hypothetical protein
MIQVRKSVESLEEVPDPHQYPVYQAATHKPGSTASCVLDYPSDPDEQMLRVGIA